MDLYHEIPKNFRYYLIDKNIRDDSKLNSTNAQSTVKRSGSGIKFWCCMSSNDASIHRRHNGQMSSFEYLKKSCNKNCRKIK